MVVYIKGTDLRLIQGHPIVHVHGLAPEPHEIGIVLIPQAHVEGFALAFRAAEIVRLARLPESWHWQRTAGVLAAAGVDGEIRSSEGREHGDHFVRVDGLLDVSPWSWFCLYQRYIEWMVGYVDVALTVGSYGGVVDECHGYMGSG